MTRKFLTPVVLPADPANALEAVTKQYVDAQFRSFATKALLNAWSPAWGATGWVEAEGNMYYRVDNIWRFAFGVWDPTYTLAYVNANQGAATAWRKATLNAVSTDFGGCFNISTNTYTVPYGGRIQVESTMTNSALADTLCGVQINTFSASPTYIGSPQGSTRRTSVAGTYPVVTGDLVTVWFYTATSIQLMGGLGSSYASFRMV